MCTCSCQTKCASLEAPKKTSRNKFMLPVSAILFVASWQVAGISIPLPYTMASVNAYSLEEIGNTDNTATEITTVELEDNLKEEAAFEDKSTDIIEAAIGSLTYNSSDIFDVKQVELASKALEFAVKQAGKPYVAGMRGPNSFDCSGFTYAAYKAAGLNWTMMTSYNQRKSKFVTNIEPGSEMPGDLIFTDFLRDGSQIPRGLAGPEGVDHVGMILDPRKGTMIESVGGRGVVVSKYHTNGKYLPQLISFGRVSFY